MSIALDYYSREYESIRRKIAKTTYLEEIEVVDELHILIERGYGSGPRIWLWRRNRSDIRYFYWIVVDNIIVINFFSFLILVLYYLLMVHHIFQ